MHEAKFAAGDPSPTSQIDPGEDHLAILRRDRPDLLHDLVRGREAIMAANEGNYTE
jgi:hypothetical protein